MATIKLPSYQPPVEQARRPTATSINRSQPREQNLTVSGYNEVVPLVYGVDKVSGPMIAGPVSRGGWAYWGVAISHGPIDGYDKVIIGTDEHEVTDTSQTITGDGFTYHLTFYDGTQTSVDANLAEGIEFFGDVFNGVAYVSVKAQGENMSMTNGLVFKIRGKKVLDPRDNTLKFTENPALHLNDFITNSYYGLGREAIGVEALADHCDSSFGGAPRCRTSTVMQSGLSEESAIDLLATYAEALWAYQGGSVYLVPDAAVAQEDIIDIPMQQIFGGSVQLMTELAQDIPSSVTLTYNSDASDGLAGEPVFVSKEEATASTPYLNSSLTLMGVYRRAEAQRRAEQRLARLQIGGRVSFQMFDTGSLLKIGDVIRFPDRYGIGGMLLRVMAQPELVSLGVYQIRTEVYDESIYAATEVGSIVLPKGAVVPIVGDDEIPNGMSALDLGKEFFISGSSDYSGYMIGGAEDGVDIVSDTISTSISGGHSSPLSGGGRYSGFASDVGSGSLERGEHYHEVNVKIKSESSFRVGRTAVRMAVVDSEQGSDIKRGFGFLSRVRKPTPYYYPVSDVNGWMTAGLTSLMEIKQAQPEPLGTEESGSHNHYGGRTTYGFDNERVFYSDSRVEGQTYRGSVTRADVGGHSHTSNFSVSLSLRSKLMILHVMTVAGGSVPFGGIVGYIGETIPEGWALCDGENGTEDLVDFFIKLDGEDDLRALEDNSISFSCSTTEPGGRHNHYSDYREDPSSGSRTVYRGNHSLDHGLHTHEINYEKTIPFTPRHIKLAFIQYVGE